MGFFKADRRLYLTSDRKHVVEEGDPKAAFLLVPEGGEMLEEEARRLGLVKQLAKVQDKSIAKVATK